MASNWSSSFCAFADKPLIRLSFNLVGQLIMDLSQPDQLLLMLHWIPVLIPTHPPSGVLASADALFLMFDYAASIGMRIPQSQGPLLRAVHTDGLNREARPCAHCSIPRPTRQPINLVNYIPDSKVHGPTWGPSGANRTQVGPMLAPWTSLCGMFPRLIYISILWKCIHWNDVLSGHPSPLIHFYLGPGLLGKFHIEINIFVNKDFKTWNLIGCKHSRQPLWSHVRKSLIINMAFNMDFT